MQTDFIPAQSNFDGHKHCPHCGAQVLADRTVCPICQKDLAEPVVEVAKAEEATTEGSQEEQSSS